MALARLVPACLLALVATAPAHAAVSLRAVSSATANADLVLPRPAGTQPGDVLLATVTRRHPPTAPSGWTLLRDSPGGPGSTRTWWRRAAAGDPASWTFTAAGGGTAGGMSAFSGTDPTSPVEAVGATSGTGSTVSWPSMTVASAGSVVALHASTAAGGAAPTPGGGWTVRWTAPRSDMTALGGESALADPGRAPAFDATIPRAAWVAHAVVLRAPPSLTATFPGDLDLGTWTPGVSAVSSEQALSVTSTDAWGLRIASDDPTGRMRRWDGTSYVAGSLQAALQWRRSSFDGAAQATAFADLSGTPTTVISGRAGRSTPVTAGVTFRQAVGLGDPVPPPGQTYRILVTYQAAQGF